VTSATIRDWDPYALLSGGAPLDEWDAEIAQLVTHIPRIACVSDATRAISAVFSKSFDPDTFCSDKCAAVGEAWFKSLLHAGLVQDAQQGGSADTSSGHR
jgi:hypothetical protein